MTRIVSVIHFVMVCVRGGGKCDHSRLLLEKPQRAAVPVYRGMSSRSKMRGLSWPAQPRRCDGSGVEG